MRIQKCDRSEFANPLKESKGKALKLSTNKDNTLTLYRSIKKMKIKKVAMFPETKGHKKKKAEMKNKVPIALIISFK